MKTTSPFFATGLLALLALAGCATAQTPPGPLAHEQAGSAAQLEPWVARLHDRDYASRNAAVQALAAQANDALPLLEKALKTETDDSRRWWLQVAIQECKDNGLNPGDIFATPDRSAGLQVCEECKTGGADGPFTIVEHDGVHCWQVPRKVGKQWSYLYFSADDAFRRQAGRTLDIQLDFLDADAGEIVLEYDSTDSQAAVNGAYKLHPYTVRRTNAGKWRTARFHLTEARFQGSENNHTDFRFSNGGDDLLVRSVFVRRPTP